MERFLIKTAIHGFICSLATGILLFSKDMIIWGSSVTFPRSWGDYFVDLIRLSIVVTLVIVLVGFFYKRSRQARK